MLSPQDHEALARLQLLARGVVEGVSGGRHRSPHKGASVEFKEHRQYTRGDEIRSIDWKLFGKTDRLFIRQYEDETNLRAMLLVDQSGSMAYRGARATVSKHQFAVRLAACLATLLIKQQDAVGLATLDDQVRAVIPPRSTTSHLLAIYETLVQSKCLAETSLATALRQASAQLRRRGLLLLISDCFDAVDELISALRTYLYSGSEVIVFQIWDRDELDFPFHARTQFRSLENSTKQHLIDPVALRSAYLERLKTFRQQLTLGLARERVELVSCTTDQDLSELLTAYVGHRRGRREKRP
ncbi:MAG: DUF58 domain-containing protein [Planctomycetales bacterium]|nr:DUF58 domain-containing protein [Planctomycetales bacterium]